jgi:exopolysaccharide biosynthesis predicted pyruvyltransferase EpsI
MWFALRDGGAHQLVWRRIVTELGSTPNVFDHSEKTDAPMSDVPIASEKNPSLARVPGSISEPDPSGSLPVDAAVRPFGLPRDAESLHAILCERLAAIRGKNIVLLLNRGNRGDGVIHKGGRRLLKSIGLTWQEIHEPEAPSTISADVLLVIAGGAFCRYTHSIVAVVKRYESQVDQVIILPASFDLRCPQVRRFAGTWSDKYTVFCRERRSFDALTRAEAGPKELRLAHDLAFWADLRSWAMRPHAGTVGIFRRDREAVFEQRPINYQGKDISRGSDGEPELLLDYVSRFSTIHTDRTHAAITGAMMGREVWLYRNAYFKNQAIFEHSLSHLPNVHFVGKQPFSFRQLGATLYTHYVQRNAYHLKQKLRLAREKFAARFPAAGR